MLRVLHSRAARASVATFINNRSTGALGNARKVQSRSISQVITLTDESISKFKEGNDRVVLYYTATWCPPCKVIKPIYEELSENYEKVAFGKVDVDDCPDAAADANIRSVPTFVFLKDNSPVKEFAGADKKMLEGECESVCQVKEVIEKGWGGTNVSPILQYN